MSMISSASSQEGTPIRYVCGIDTGSHSCSGCVCRLDKGVGVKPMTFANTADGWNVWFDQLTQLDAAPNQIVIGMEATSRYHENLYYELEQRGYVLCLLHPGQTHQFHRQQGRLTKTDRLDAMTIAKVLLTWGSAGRRYAKRAYCELSRIGPFAHPTLRRVSPLSERDPGSGSRPHTPCSPRCSLILVCPAP
jgi:hypothetical protein